MKKDFKNLIWFDGVNKDFTMDENREFAFSLSLGSLVIGFLSFFDKTWHFSYSDEFKSQNAILPIINFPDVNRNYVDRQLWSFFASRIPSKAQRIGGNKDSNDVYYLLKKYGKNVIANPYILNPVT